MAVEDYAVFVMFAAFIAGMIVNTILAVRSSRRGDSLWQEGWKKTLAAIATMISVAGILFLIGNKIFHIR